MLDHIHHALQERELETARRLCLQELASATPATRPALVALVHDALSAEGVRRLEGVAALDAPPAGLAVAAVNLEAPRGLRCRTKVTDGREGLCR